MSQGVYASPEALDLLREALGAAAMGTREVMAAAAAEARRCAAVLEERKAECEQVTRRLQEQLRYADEDEAAELERRLEEAVQWRRRIGRSQRHLGEAIAAYGTTAAEVSRLVEDSTPSAQAHLRQKAAELQAYFGVGAGRDRTAASVASADAGQGDGAQMAAAIAALGQMPALQTGAWTGLSAEERLAALNQVEQTLALTQGREAVTVEAADLPRWDHGGYSRERGVITVNAADMAQDLPEVVDTVAHEGRHAYQCRAVETPGLHHDEAEVEQWRRNIDHYIRPEQDPRGYEEQPLEKDAFAFGRRVRAGLFAGEAGVI